MRSRVSIERNNPRCAVLLHCLDEEAFRCRNIASFTQQEVYRPTLLVHCTIQVGPTALHLYIGLITTPRPTHWPRVLVPALLELRHIALHPAQNRSVRQCNSTLRHHLDQIPRTQFESEIPSHAQHDDFPVEMSSLKRIKCSHPVHYCPGLQPHADFAPEPDLLDPDADAAVMQPQPEARHDEGSRAR